MIQRRFKILFSVVVCLAFFKIYQHNLLVQLTYQHQRLVMQKKRLEQERNEQYIAYLSLHNPEAVFTVAKDKLSMKALTVTQLRTIPNTSLSIDCLHTTSHDSVLKTIGLYDMTVGKTGGAAYVRA